MLSSLRKNKRVDGFFKNIVVDSDNASFSFSFRHRVDVFENI